jgi:hypothetical protein
MVRTPFVYPEAYFGRRDGFSLARSFGVILALWLSTLLGTIALVLLLVTRVPAAPSGSVGEIIVMAFGQALPILLTLVLSWVILGVVLHVAASLKGGSGSFGKTLSLAGWGLGPTVVVILITFALAGVTVATTRFPADLQAAAEQFGTVLANADGGFGIVLQFGAAIWQAYIFAGGLSVGHDLEWGDAAVAAGVVALVGFLIAAA